jgi:hypothetical protein
VSSTVARHNKVKGTPGPQVRTLRRGCVQGSAPSSSRSRRGGVGGSFPAVKPSEARLVEPLLAPRPAPPTHPSCKDARVRPLLACGSPAPVASRARGRQGGGRGGLGRGARREAWNVGAKALRPALAQPALPILREQLLRIHTLPPPPRHCSAASSSSDLPLTRGARSFSLRLRPRPRVRHQPPK